MIQNSSQTQLLLHEPEARDEYVIDSSEEFNQDALDVNEEVPLVDGTSHECAKHRSMGEPVGETGNTQTDYAALIETATPAMKQYFKAKAEHEDSLLFYRMGDFYEMFFDDALEAAEILDIALTKRGKQGDEDIPMCGVPAHAYEQYAQRLIKAGKRVAVCEQMETPEEAKKRGHKSVVRREVVRILTPGTLTEEALLDASTANFLASMASADGKYALAWLDCSTGEVYTTLCEQTELAASLSRINPKELVFSDRLREQHHLVQLWQEWADISLTKPDHLFEISRASRRICETYTLATLGPLEVLHKAELSALGALLEYVAITQKNQMPRLDMPKRQMSSEAMQIDQATQRNLELVVRQNGEKKLSLLYTIDKTQTASGSRLLASRITAPLTNVAAINARLDAADFFLAHAPLRAECIKLLASATDSERALSRLVMDRASPRDVLAIKHNLIAARDLNGLFERSNTKALPALLHAAWQALRGHEELIELLENAVKPDASGLLRDGGFIRNGYHAALDEFRRLKENGKQEIAKLQQQYQQETGINGLKIKYNQVLGYFVEITQAHQSKITERFIHRQSLASALRYTTTELSELEQNIAQAGDRALKLELELFEKLKNEIIVCELAIIGAARALAEMDVYSALAELAAQENYVRPVIDKSMRFEIEAGRHPVVEKSIKKSGEQFAPNGCAMAEQSRLWLLTGPNMAGKSTYLRQNALIAILAQMGSFVPVKSAHIGVIDKLFSRVGAADDLARGQSTFMVEMTETAAILAQATSRSFVILDEIGRGTATYDGLSIAWAVVEYLHNQLGCRTLFATHYHELTDLENKLEALSCYHLRVKEFKQQLIFMHEVVPGHAEGSYGVHVARLAGLPADVIIRATTLLAQLETQPANVGHKLEHAPIAVAQPQHPLIEKMKKLDPNSLSPREALDALFKLKELTACE